MPLRCPGRLFLSRRWPLPPAGYGRRRRAGWPGRRRTAAAALAGRPCGALPVLLAKESSKLESPWNRHARPAASATRWPLAAPPPGLRSARRPGPAGGAGWRGPPAAVPALCLPRPRSCAAAPASRPLPPGFGAAYGTAKAGVGIASMGVMRPELVMKSIVPVVMAGVLGIYGLIVAVIIGTNSCAAAARARAGAPQPAASPLSLHPSFLPSFPTPPPPSLI